MKASFIILPALLMSAAPPNRAGGKAGREKRAGSAQGPPSPAPRPGWFGWLWPRRPAPKNPAGTK